MKNFIKDFDKILEDLALRVVTLDAEDIPALGEILNLLSSLEEKSREHDPAAVTEIVTGLKIYIEKLIFGEKKDTEPLDEGITVLQRICRCLENGEAFNGELEPLLKSLGAERSRKKSEAAAEPSIDGGQDRSSEPAVLSVEDIQILSDFIVESQENLESIEINLIELENAPDDREIIDAIFRPFHTIKGVSGFLNLHKINHLAHSTENLLDSVRRGLCVIDDQVTDIVLESVDTLRKLILGVEENLETGCADLETDIDVAPLIDKIEALDAEKTTENTTENTIESNTENTPPLVGELLIEKGLIEKRDLDQGLDVQQQHPDRKIGEILVDDKKIAPQELESVLQDQKKIKRLATLQVKVDTHKLDNLVDLTGELVISQSMLKQNGLLLNSNDQKLHQNLNQLAYIVSSIQKIAMSLRMVPIKSTFQKMVRLVRDLARNSGKEIELQMFGEDTEIDRNVVDALYEPMVHMIRNAADHGIESADQRRRSGKDPQGRIQLKAYHKGGNIVIEIEDDGKGLNKERILEKAKANDLIAAGASLTESEIYELIMQPGFSTAREITDVSGRGVGMDVVKKGIEKIRGRLEIRSTPGEGSLFIITLPLTLAIIEGMLVRVGKERYIIPTMAILESFKPRKQEYYTVEGKGEMVMVRGKLIPLIRLDQICDIQGDASDPWDGLVVVVESKGEQRGLLLDDLLGKGEFVIKSLGESLKGIRGLAGGAILGDGRVGLILDIAELFDISFKQAA